MVTKSLLHKVFFACHKKVKYCKPKHRCLLASRLPLHILYGKLCQCAPHKQNHHIKYICVPLSFVALDCDVDVIHGSIPHAELLQFSAAKKQRKGESHIPILDVHLTITR